MPLSHLTDHSEIASHSRVDCVRAGLKGPAVDRPIWRRAAELRIQELERHGFLFGLEAYEQEEIETLRTLLKNSIDIGYPTSR